MTIPLVIFSLKENTSQTAKKATQCGQEGAKQVYSPCFQAGSSAGASALGSGPRGRRFKSSLPDQTSFLFPGVRFFDAYRRGIMAIWKMKSSDLFWKDGAAGAISLSRYATMSFRPCLKRANTHHRRWDGRARRWLSFRIRMISPLYQK